MTFETAFVVSACWELCLLHFSMHCIMMYFFYNSDHKSDMAIELKEELEQIRLIAQKLQQDKRELAEDAKAARAYRDEIEMLKVQSAKAERLETDVIKYRQKAEDAEYLKKKIAVSEE